MFALYVCDMCIACLTGRGKIRLDKMSESSRTGISGILLPIPTPTYTKYKVSYVKQGNEDTWELAAENPRGS